MTVMVLTGGVGGAKLALGLYRNLPANDLIAVVNTGDDFGHLGLHVSPDLDTLMYTLAGLSNPQTGWGRDGESWRFMQALEELGGPTWFALGDTDLALNVQRSALLKEGRSLSEITRAFCERLNVAAKLLPMSDDPVRTHVHSEDGVLAFQEYFVARRCEPKVTGFSFVGSDKARAQTEVLASMHDGRLRAIIVCPSNPFISIDPILSIPKIRDTLTRLMLPVVAVSPVVDGKAIKGPTTKMMRELGIECSSLAVRRHYGSLISGFVVDSSDEVSDEAFDLPILRTDTIMTDLADKTRLAGEVLAFAESLRRSPA